MGSFTLEKIRTKLRFFTKHSLIGLLMVANSLFLTASAQSDGNLSVSISGLPNGVAANVVVGQLNGDYSHAIDAGGTFTGLAVGDYLVVAVPVNAQGVSYEVSNPVARWVTIRANSNHSIDITYQRSETALPVTKPANSTQPTDPITPVTILPSDVPSIPVSVIPTTSNTSSTATPVTILPSIEPINAVVTVPSTSSAATPVTILPFPDSPILEPISSQPISSVQPVQPIQPELPTNIGSINGNSIISLGQGTNILEGMVFYDKNNNGINEGTESPIVNMEVFLDLNQNNVKEANEPATVTNTKGFYRFEGLANKNYTVMQNLPFSWSNTTAAQLKVGTIAGGLNLPEIVGGSFANFEDYPFIAALALRHDINIGNYTYAKGQPLCGGSLIAGNWIMTAAHCVYNSNNPNEAAFLVPLTTQNLSVFIGGNQIRNGKVNADKMIDVVKIIVHPEYRPAGLQNDIALLQLAEPVRFPRVILPDPVIAKQIYLPNTMSTILGWGNTQANDGSEDGPTPILPEFLQKAEVRIWEQRVCVLLPDYQGLRARQFCAGYEQGLIDACQGDSGGPLIVRNQNQWYQAGIVSTGFGCAQPNKPGIYTRVSEYLEWIFQNTNPEVSQRVDVTFSISGGKARVDFGNFR